MPDFLLNKVPYVKLKGEWKGNPAEMRYRKDNRVPRYDHPAYQAAFRELNGLLAAEFNGHPQIEFVDTMMYGFWGEGHTWPYEGNPFPSQLVAEQTWAAMFEAQLDQWTKVPLATNTQPDFSNVGNSDMVDRTIRTANWLRTDTIFIENTQIEALSYRPPWVAAICEVGFTTGDAKELRIDEDGITYNEQIISHVADVGVNYLSLWSWHNQSARSITSYYEKFPGTDRRDRPPDRLPHPSVFYLGLHSRWGPRAGRRTCERWNRIGSGSSPLERAKRRPKDPRFRLRRRRLSKTHRRPSSHADAACGRKVGRPTAESRTRGERHALPGSLGMSTKN